MSMITDTNGDAHLKELARVAEAAAAEDRPAGGNHLAIKRYKFVDPDKEFDEMVHTVSTRFVEVDAKMMEQRGRGYEQVHYRSLKEMMAAKPIRRRVLNVLSGSQLREINERLGGLRVWPEGPARGRAKGRPSSSGSRSPAGFRKRPPASTLGSTGTRSSCTGRGSRRPSSACRTPSCRELAARRASSNSSSTTSTCTGSHGRPRRATRWASASWTSSRSSCSGAG